MRETQERGRRKVDRERNAGWEKNREEKEKEKERKKKGKERKKERGVWWLAMAGGRRRRPEVARDGQNPVAQAQTQAIMGVQV